MSMITPQWTKWLAEHKGWDQWFARQVRDWEQALAYRDQGFTLGQAASALGHVPEQLDAEELEDKVEKQAKQLTDQDITITRGMAENRALREENEELREQLAAFVRQSDERAKLSTARRWRWGR